MGANTDTPLPPTKIVAFADYPNAPLSNIGDAIPIVFGDMDVGGDPLHGAAGKGGLHRHPVVQIHSRASRGKTYGGVYVYAPKSVQGPATDPAHANRRDRHTLSTQGICSAGRGKSAPGPIHITILTRSLTTHLSCLRFSGSRIQPGLEHPELASIPGPSSGGRMTIFLRISPGSYLRADLQPIVPTAVTVINTSLFLLSTEAVTRLE